MAANKLFTVEVPLRIAGDVIEVILLHRRHGLLRHWRREQGMQSLLVSRIKAARTVSLPFTGRTSLRDQLIDVLTILDNGGSRFSVAGRSKAMAVSSGSWFDADFDQYADESGGINVTREVDLPFSVRLRDFCAQTNSGCADRTHPLLMEIVKKENNAVVKSVQRSVRDCIGVSGDLDLRVPPGQYLLRLASEGFDSHERVQGRAAIKVTI